jgi:ATP-binding protein involved in chromosome partitioning
MTIDLNSAELDSAARALLATVFDPRLGPAPGKDLISAKMVGAIAINAGSLCVDLELPYAGLGEASLWQERISKALAGIAPNGQVKVNLSVNIKAKAVSPSMKRLGNIKNVIAVASGKGGVGKSTTAANLALALAAEGARVGMLDADVYGPSQTMMMGTQGKASANEQKKIEPMLAHGVQVISMGMLLTGDDTPMVWRGPMASSAMEQLLTETAWNKVDYLIVDMPPGTGDIQLTLAQKVPVTGAVIVTTPQDIALLDAKKGLVMFEKVKVPILGIIENMAMHVCSKCGHVEHIFGQGGGERMADQYTVQFLGSLPLDIRIREQADSGNPSVVAEPNGPIAAAYKEIARTVGARIALLAEDHSSKFPSIKIVN